MTTGKYNLKKIHNKFIFLVGYGDIFPKTILGRIIIFINCIWGVFLYSLIVVSVTTVLALGPLEKKCYAISRKIEKREIFRNYAVNLIIFASKHFFFKNANYNQTISQNNYHKFQKYLRKFKFQKRLKKYLIN